VASPVTGAARQFAGAAPDLSTATAALHRSAGSLRVTLTPDDVAIGRASVLAGKGGRMRCLTFTMMRRPSMAAMAEGFEADQKWNAVLGSQIVGSGSGCFPD
jgi:hypothetical protein